MSSDPAPEPPLGRVAVLGLGVMGGSLCRALSDTGLAERVTGWSPVATEREAAEIARAVDFAAAEWRGAVRDADLVVLATPLSVVLELLPQVATEARSATLTDVASLKAPVARAAVACGAADRWVGSHPMAGSERSGFWASRADLYRGARVWLGRSAPHTGGREDGATGAARVEALWTGVGATPAWIEPELHDQLMAVASHLPQLVSNALAEVMEQAGVGRGQLGPGGRDMTRLAGSSPEMWAELLAHPDPSLIRALRGLGRSAEQLAAALESGDTASVVRLMRRTAAWRDR